MATISSMLKIVDGFTSPIQKNINIMNRMIDVMEQMNQAGNMPGLESAFNEMRTDISLVNHELDVLSQNLKESGNTGAAATAKISGGFGGVSKAIVVANQGLQLLKQGYQSLQNFMSGADERTGADARLSLIRDELRTQEQLEAQVMAVSNATRTQYETTAELVAKMGRQDYFKGQNDKALAFAKTLNQGMIVSGASVTETNSALLQLSQGIASGVLRGDEFNSIMENGSVLAEMMAKSLGVTKGELREMAADGMLTAEAVVSSIMQQADVIDQQFSSMPVTFGQVQTQMGNLWSQMLNNMSQAGQPIDAVILKMQELYAWLSTMEGQQFMSGLASGIGFTIDGAVQLSQIIGDIYTFFVDNWSTIEPILWGVGFAVGAITTALLVYKAVQWISTSLTIASAIASGARTVALGGETVATTAAASAQWGLNAALLANPVTWIILAIVALIAIIIALSIWLYRLWQTNIDFRVGVIGVWNNMLGFFDQVPIFFQMVGNGVLDGLSYMKVGAALILQDMVNDAIAKINMLIELANKIPGVSIDAIGAVDFGAQTAIEEEIKRQERASDLQASRDAAALKAAERANQLAQDETRWRQEAAEKEAALQEEQKKNDANNTPFDPELDWGPVEVGGGSLDKVGKIGKEVDISKQSLQYLRDIAEIQALESVNAYSTVSYEGISQASLSKADADLLKSAAGQSTKVYYLNYSGGVRIRNDIKQGQDWDSIRRQMEEEIDNDIESGLSDIDKVVNG